MFLIDVVVIPVVKIIMFVLQLYMYILVGRAVISWVSADPYNPIVRFLYEATEPLLSRIRRALPFVVGGIDFSPMVLILAILFSQNVLDEIVKKLAGF